MKGVVVNLAKCVLCRQDNNIMLRHTQTRLQRGFPRTVVMNCFPPTKLTDLAPSDYCLFPNLEKHLSVDEFIAELRPLRLPLRRFWGRLTKTSTKLV
jgi:hypothetical protein